MFLKCFTGSAFSYLCKCGEENYSIEDLYTLLLSLYSPVISPQMAEQILSKYKAPKHLTLPLVIQDLEELVNRAVSIYKTSIKRSIRRALDATRLVLMWKVVLLTTWWQIIYDMFNVSHVMVQAVSMLHPVVKSRRKMLIGHRSKCAVNAMCPNTARVLNLPSIGRR